MIYRLIGVFVFLLILSSQHAAHSTDQVTLVCKGETTHLVPSLGPVVPSDNPFSIQIDLKRRQVIAPIMFPACGKNFEQFEKCACDFTSRTISCQGAGRSKEKPRLVSRFFFSLDRYTGIFDGQNLHSLTNEEGPYQNTDIYQYKCEVSERKF